jgi:hypothetical protein
MWKASLGAAVALACASSAFAQSGTATMGAQTSVFTGNTRGYYFTAPVDFTITGVQVLVPTGSSNAFQNFAILHFTGNVPPPTFPSTTNAFTQLALGLDLPQNAFQPVNVPVMAGDVIGVYGNTAAAMGTSNGQNSYAGGVQQTTMIGSNLVNLFRSGMQFHLGSATSPLGMHDVWFENNFNISRVEFTYTMGPGSPTVYCTAGTSSNGCVPAISAVNQPSVTQANPCDIGCANVEGQKSGLFFYGVDNGGFSPTPWGIGGNSFLCVKAPTQRTPTQSSGGTSGMCDGSFFLDWNAFQTANPASLGNPWMAGDDVFGQFWYRDPPAVKTTNLSDAVELTYVP